MDKALYEEYIGSGKSLRQFAKGKGIDAGNFSRKLKKWFRENPQPVSGQSSGPSISPKCDHPLDEPDMTKTPPAPKPPATEKIEKRTLGDHCYWGGIIDSSGDVAADRKRVVKQDAAAVYFADGSIGVMWYGNVRMIHYHDEKTCYKSRMMGELK